MTRTLLVLIAGVVLGVLFTRGFMAGGAPQRPAADAAAEVERDDGAAPRGATAGAAELMLDQAAINLAGIKTATLAVIQALPARASYGRVADRLALIADHAATAEARALAAAQHATQAALAERLTRLRGYARAGEVSVAQELARLELEAHREAAQATLRETAVKARERALVARWGERLAALARTDPPLWEALVAGRECLLEFVSPAAAPTVLAGTTLEVARDGGRAGAQAARVLGPAPAALGSTQGARWFAVTACGDLQSGQRVSVWLPSGGEVVSGALLPAAAMVWDAGQRWYFVATAPGRYQRRRVPEGADQGADVLLTAGQTLPVVVRGAQTLLAEQQRAAIPEEDDD